MKGMQSEVQLGATLALCLALNTFGQTVKLEHDSSWEIVGRQGTIRALQLANLGSEETGPLFLSVYAKGGVGYDGTGSPGALLIRAPIGSIAGNAIANNIQTTAKARLLPPGEKFTVLVVEKQEGRKFTVLDYVVYTSSYTFPRRQNGGVGSDDSAIGSGDVAIRGATSLTVTGRRADFVVEEIQNEREVATTGDLRLAIYATPEPYNGSASPVVLAVRPLGQLAQGDFYNHLQGRLTLKRPGRGQFYLTLAVEEDRGSGFQPVTFVADPNPHSF